LRRFAYDIILYLHAAPGVIARRIREEVAGRHFSGAHGIETLDSVQMAICTYYAGVIGCPLEIIDAAGQASEIAHVLEGILGLAPGPV
jgi:adenylate kinase